MDFVPDSLLRDLREGVHSSSSRLHHTAPLRQSQRLEVFSMVRQQDNLKQTLTDSQHLPFIASRRPRLISPPKQRVGSVRTAPGSSSHHGRQFATAADPSNIHGCVPDPSSWAMQYVGDQKQLRETDALPRLFDPSRTDGASASRFFYGGFAPVAAKGKVVAKQPRPKEIIPEALPEKLQRRVAQNHKLSKRVDRRTQLFEKMKNFKSPIELDSKFVKDIRLMVSTAVASHVYRTFEESTRTYYPDYLRIMKEAKQRRQAANSQAELGLSRRGSLGGLSRGSQSRNASMADLGMAIVSENLLRAEASKSDGDDTPKKQEVVKTKSKGKQMWGGHTQDPHSAVARAVEERRTAGRRPFSNDRSQPKHSVSRIIALGPGARRASSGTGATKTPRMSDFRPDVEFDEEEEDGARQRRSSAFPKIVLKRRFSGTDLEHHTARAITVREMRSQSLGVRRVRSLHDMSGLAAAAAAAKPLAPLKNRVRKSKSRVSFKMGPREMDDDDDNGRRSRYSDTTSATELGTEASSFAASEASSTSIGSDTEGDDMPPKETLLGRIRHGVMKGVEAAPLGPKPPAPAAAAAATAAAAPPPPPAQTASGLSRESTSAGTSAVGPAKSSSEGSMAAAPSRGSSQALKASTARSSASQGPTEEAAGPPAPDATPFLAGLAADAAPPASRAASLGSASAPYALHDSLDSNQGPASPSAPASSADTDHQLSSALEVLGLNTEPEQPPPPAQPSAPDRESLPGQVGFAEPSFRYARMSGSFAGEVEDSFSGPPAAAPVPEPPRPPSRDGIRYSESPTGPVQPTAEFSSRSSLTGQQMALAQRTSSLTGRQGSLTSMGSLTSQSGQPRGSPQRARPSPAQPPPQPTKVEVEVHAISPWVDARVDDAALHAEEFSQAVASEASRTLEEWTPKTLGPGTASGHLGLGGEPSAQISMLSLGE